MALTIVITTFNRKLVLKRLLQSLVAQSDPDFQVVVAIDGSTDGTEAMLDGIVVPFPLKWVNTHCRGYGLAVARNLGILAAETPIIAIIDDDCFPCPDYVAAHKRSVRHHTITGGPRTPATAGDVKQVEKMVELNRLPACEPVTLTQLREQWPKAVATECNVCMYRRDLIDMGLFSERLKIYGFIGQEMFARADHLGYRYQYNPEAEIVHDRQPMGDNGLTRWRRTSQIILARALNPSFMKPDQYQQQIRWALRMETSYPVPSSLPPLPKYLLAAFPYRLVRNRFGDVRRWLRAKSQTTP